MADQSISEEQKQALVRIYLSFRREYEDEHGAPEPEGQDPGTRRRLPTRRVAGAADRGRAAGPGRARRLGLSPGSSLPAGLAGLAGALFAGRR